MPVTGRVFSQKVFHCILEWKYRKQRWNEEEEEDVGLVVCGSQKRSESGEAAVLKQRAWNLPGGKGQEA